MGSKMYLNIRGLRFGRAAPRVGPGVPQPEAQIQEGCQITTKTKTRFTSKMAPLELNYAEKAFKKISLHEWQTIIPGEGEAILW
jgi:hypothetical protein